MKALKYLNFLTLSCLIACSTSFTEVVQETHQYSKGRRSIATIDFSRNEYSEEKIHKTIKGIFHSYLLGQQLLEKFDKSLDENPATAMDSDSYNELLVIRSMVDQFEESINEMYLNLVLVSALPEYNEKQKTTAKNALDIIGKFFEGTEIPENLQHLVLGNLREKQNSLYDELHEMSQDDSITQNDPEVKNTLHQNMALLRGTRLKFFKKIKNYFVDKKVFNKTLEEQNLDKDFKEFKNEVRRASKDMKKLTRKITRGRSTSSDIIFSSTTTAGNIVGNGFPANTWSLTYDDGPGGKTTPTVLKNLKAHNMHATFFMLAKQVEGLPTTAKSVADAGMDIACHSYDHQQLTKSGVNLDKQIGGAKTIIETKLGKPIKLFRLPYGAGVNVSRIRTKIAEEGLIHVFWNVDTLDWQDKNPTSIFNRAVKQMKASPKNSGVILFHDIHAQSVIASELLMTYFTEQKINVCTVQSVVDQLNQGLATCQP